MARLTAGREHRRMHELAITEGIVASVCNRVGEVQVRKITVEIGALTTVLPDAVRFAFDVCTSGTRCEGAELEIVEIPARARCRACGDEFTLSTPVLLCRCGAGALDVLSGQDLRIRSVEVE
jgi:hydrogenase nickel incorporation protein HypA/HybF